MTRLAVLLRAHSGPIEADFAREYPRDADQLVEFWRGRLTVRRALVLIDHLPPGSALWRALKIDAAWTEEAHLLAHTVDALHGANWQRSNGKGPQPKPIDRPSDFAAKARREDLNRARAERYLARHRERQAEGGRDDA